MERGARREAAKKGAEELAADVVGAEEDRRGLPFAGGASDKRAPKSRKQAPKIGGGFGR
jgi:hypothetical protein